MQLSARLTDWIANTSDTRNWSERNCAAVWKRTSCINGNSIRVCNLLLMPLIFIVTRIDIESILVIVNLETELKSHFILFIKPQMCRIKLRIVSFIFTPRYLHPLHNFCKASIVLFESPQIFTLKINQARGSLSTFSTKLSLQRRWLRKAWPTQRGHFSKPCPTESVIESVNKASSQEEDLNLWNSKRFNQCLKSKHSRLLV